jgi:dGTP triphosphohydrolase
VSFRAVARNLGTTRPHAEGRRDCLSPKLLPPEPPSSGGGLGGETARRVADYVASMTDRFAIELYEQVFVPQHWSV